MKDNLIYKFLTETINRLLAKSSKYVQIIQMVAIGCTLVTGLPAFLEFIGVTNLAPWFLGLENKIIYVAGLVSAFVLQLEVPKDITKVENPEVLLTNTTEIHLPFTDATQK